MSPQAEWSTVRYWAGLLIRVGVILFNFLKIVFIYFEREKGGAEGENSKETPCSEQSPMWGLMSQP